MVTKQFVRTFRNGFIPTGYRAAPLPQAAIKTYLDLGTAIRLLRYSSYRKVSIDESRIDD
jgi:hypothetical protein